MSIFDHLSQQNFIKNYWQQQPLVFSQSFTDLVNMVDGNELAGLACEQEVESRIINGYEMDGNWQCQQGPFGETDFASLPEQNWTLLIQGVDQWDDQISDILNQFDFLPKWRLEDIMASYAPVGGSVGPHFDYYDVFLIQVSGSREWQIGQQCNHASQLQDNTEVKLLSEFNCTDRHTLSAGDMIYIPAGIAHWGKSLSDDCITFSVGFRAPSQKEVIVEALECLIQHFESSQEDNQRYQDTAASVDAHSHKINHAAHTQLQSASTLLSPDLLSQSIQQAFGQLVTDPRYDPFDQNQEKKWTKVELLKAFKHQTKLLIRHSSNSRFAFSDTQLFVNGEAYTSNAEFSQSVCDKNIVKPHSEQQIEILLKLLNQQFISIEI